MKKLEARSWKLEVRHVLFFLASNFLLLASSVIAAGEIAIENVAVERKTSSQYVLSATVINQSPEPREVILRAQISFYDKAAPKGDLPVAVLRKDVTVVLRKEENRRLAVDLVEEGPKEKGSIRLEPSLRIRRQRPWSY